MPLAEMRRPAIWDRARVSAVAPIGLIVAIAIICIAVAVATSVRRADEVAVSHDAQLFINAIAQRRERVLLELESVARSDRALPLERSAFDADWIHHNLAATLRTHFSHDYVFVADAADRIVYPVPGPRTAEPAWFDMIRPDLGPILGHLRGRDPVDASQAAGAIPDGVPRSAPRRDRRVQSFMNRPAIVDGSNSPNTRQMAVGPSNSSP